MRNVIVMNIKTLLPFFIPAKNVPWIIFVCDRLPRIENFLQKDRPEVFMYNP